MADRTKEWVMKQTDDEVEEYMVYKISNKGKEKVMAALRFDMDSRKHSVIESVVKSQSPYIIRDNYDDAFKTFMYICKGKVSEIVNNCIIGLPVEDFDELSRKYSRQFGKDIATIKLPKVDVPKLKELKTSTTGIDNSFEGGCFRQQPLNEEQPQVLDMTGASHEGPSITKTETKTVADQSQPADDLTDLLEATKNMFESFVNVMKKRDNKSTVKNENQIQTSVESSDQELPRQTTTMTPIKDNSVNEISVKPKTVEVRMLPEPKRSIQEPKQKMFVRGVKVKTIEQEEMEKKQEEDLAKFRQISYEQRYLHSDVDADILINESNENEPTTNEIESWDDDNASVFIPDYIPEDFRPLYDCQKFPQYLDDQITGQSTPQDITTPFSGIKDNSKILEGKSNVDDKNNNSLGEKLVRENREHSNVKLDDKAAKRTWLMQSRDLNRIQPKHNNDTYTCYFDGFYFQGSLKLRYPNVRNIADVDMFTVTQSASDFDPRFRFGGGITGLSLPTSLLCII